MAFDVVWDVPGELRYETGLDRGVLYPPGRRAVPWNGLVSVDESTDEANAETIYFDGVKRFDKITPGDFQGKIKALTYPDEFSQFDGYSETNNVAGTFIENQTRKTFDLSYRSLIGDDGSSLEAGYKLHLLYNLTAEPLDLERETFSDSVSPNLFSWDVKGVPPNTTNYRPSAHIIIDTRRSYPEKIALIEAILYGDENTSGRLPTIEELEALTTVTITDNGDGTWTAEGPDHYIYPLVSLVFVNHGFLTETSGNILTEDGNVLTTETEKTKELWELDVFGIEWVDPKTYIISSS